ncbi:MAG TPA: hypothetical protein VGQ54_18690, partial [Burkholderiales bacterium]|nr:hypothetical protein [Burkholderiales bacterium]
RVIRAAAALLLLPSFALAQASATPPGAQSQSVELPAKEFHEECLELAAGQRLNYDFAAAKTVKFNIHYHAGGKVLYAVRKSARHARGVYTSRKAQGYCMMWTNPHSLSIALSYHFDK